MTFAVIIPETNSFNVWRSVARNALLLDIPPEEISWNAADSLFRGRCLPDYSGSQHTHVPAAFIDLARSVIWHSEAQRYALLYQALWRIKQRIGVPLSPADPLGATLLKMAKSVRRDLHKMHAFVRFREVAALGARRSFAAWFEPDHNTLEPGCAFFANRFGDMDWMIVTPKLTAISQESRVIFRAGGRKPELEEDAQEALWLTYFNNIFNPARSNVKAMQSEMPKKYWKNLPETRLIPNMLAEAEVRVRKMHDAGATQPRPGSLAVTKRYRQGIYREEADHTSLEALQQSAMQCRRCGLCEKSTQTVWGEGRSNASLMIVGEQPGDREDLEGRPFVGPAGTLLRRMMSKSGVSSDDAWLTNAVKHFKFEPRGKHRLHKTPNSNEISHCRWWLEQEIRFVKPRVILALGATAGFALTGSKVEIASQCGTTVPGIDQIPVLLSFHPAYILRHPDFEMKAKAEKQLLSDLVKARDIAGSEFA